MTKSTVPGAIRARRRVKDRGIMNVLMGGYVVVVEPPRKCIVSDEIVDAAFKELQGLKEVDGPFINGITSFTFKYGAVELEETLEAVADLAMKYIELGT